MGCANWGEPGDGTEVGPNHLDRRDKDRVAKRLIRRLEELGLKVEVRAAS